MEYAQTKRGQRALIFGGRSFRLKEEYKNGNKRWCCRSRQYNGSLITSSDENAVLKEQGHSCEPDEVNIAVEKIKEQGLKRCRAERTPVSTIHKELIASVHQEIMASAVDQGLDLMAKLPELSAIKKSMYRNRNKVCAKHFSANDIVKESVKTDAKTGEVKKIPLSRIKLKKDAVPTIFEDHPYREPSRKEKLKNHETNIPGSCNSGSKLESVDKNKPSTSTQEEILPDLRVNQDHPSTGLVYDPNIIIKQEIIETEVDPSDILVSSTFGVCPPQYQQFETITSNSPESKITQSVNLTEPLNISENILEAGKNLREVEATDLVGVEKVESAAPGESSKRFVKRNGKRPRNPSESSSEEEDGRRAKRDKFDAYGEFIASKLRDLDSRSCAFVQTAFADLIFEAELGRFLSEGDKSIFANKTLELLKTMPPPCENVS